MSCTFEFFDGEILKCCQPIPYKYVVHSPKTKDDPKNCYEFLHSHASHGQVKDRCLFIPSKGLGQVMQGDYIFLVITVVSYIY